MITRRPPWHHAGPRDLCGTTQHRASSHPPRSYDRPLQCGGVHRAQCHTLNHAPMSLEGFRVQVQQNRRTLQGRVQDSERGGREAADGWAPNPTQASHAGCTRAGGREAPDGGAVDGLSPRVGRALVDVREASAQLLASLRGHQDPRDPLCCGFQFQVSGFRVRIWGAGCGVQGSGLGI